MKYGYVRVSTLLQKRGNSLDDQKQQLLAAGVPESHIVEEYYSGKHTNRPKFQQLLATLKSGDSLYCAKLDRFARNAEEGQRVIRELTERNIAVYILNIGGTHHPFDNSPVGKLQYTMLLAFAEFERMQILERTAAGKAIARTKEGYREGRPPIARERIEEAMELLQTMTYKEVAKQTGISRTTLARYKAKYKKTQNS